MKFLNDSSNKSKFIILGILIVIVSAIFFLIPTNNCVYKTLENNKNLVEYKKIEKLFKEKMIIWQNEKRKGFLDINSIDIGPIILNSKKNKCYIILVDSLEKFTDIYMIHGRKIEQNWEFTNNGTVNTLMPRFSKNRKTNYKFAIRRILNNFKDKGYIDILSCKINDKIFYKYFFYKMEAPNAYDLDNL